MRIAGKVAVIVIPALLSVGCSGSGMSEAEQYAAGAKAARAEGCECDPFFSKAAGGPGRSGQTGPQWANGYINACIDLSRECKVGGSAGQEPVGLSGSQ